MKYKTHTKLVHELHEYMFPVQCEEIKNQASNSTSCSDRAQRSLVLVADRLYRGLQVTSSFCNLRLRSEGVVLRGVLYIF